MLVGGLVGGLAGALLAKRSKAGGAMIGAGLGAAVDYALGNTDAGARVLDGKTLTEAAIWQVDDLTMTEAQREAEYEETYGFTRADLEGWRSEG